MVRERDVLETEVLIVGAGPAGLACAYHLASEARKAGKEPPAILVIDKGSHPGAHSFSGAVMDPSGIVALMPDCRDQGMPIEAEAGADSLWYLTAKGHFRLPFIPPGMSNHGNYIISLNKFCGWLAEKTEALGVEIYPATGAYDLVLENGKVVGIQTVDSGLDKKREPKSNYEPGTIIKSAVTVLAEGTHGSLTKQAKQHLKIFDTAVNQSYLTGIKEVWEIPAGRLIPGDIIHTFGAPLPSNEYGGGFIYKMSGNLLAVGFAVGINSPDPTSDAHACFQQFKLHPSVRPFVEGGTMLHYGAKTIPEGGYYAMPRLYDDNLLVIGDSAGFLNSQRLKGIHLAIASGMMAAETIAEAFDKTDFSSTVLSGIARRFEASAARRELHKVRNYHQGFEKSVYAGMFHIPFQFISGGRGLFDRRHVEPDYAYMKKLGEFLPGGQKPPAMKFDNQLTFDKLTDVYKSGTKHEEDQPPHLVISDYNICNTRCTEEFGNPCQHFCPAHVYEMVDNDDGTPGTHLMLTPSNCVHCKTCDIADPYQIINWVVPESGGGPNYEDC
jgi:electron-transferring-flavoprotein dehydrogenase